MRTTPLEDLKEVERRCGRNLDEPDALPLLAGVRERGALTDDEWRRVLDWLADALTYQPDTVSESGAILLDADPRNADWIRIVRARRLARHEIPGWAALWLWWTGHDREDGYWDRIGEAAAQLGIPGIMDHPSV